MAPDTREMFSGRLLPLGGWVSYHLLTDLKDSWREKLKSVLSLGFHRPQASLTAGLHLSPPVSALSCWPTLPLFHHPSLLPSLQRCSSVQAFPSSAPAFSRLWHLLLNPRQPHTCVTAASALPACCPPGPGREAGRLAPKSASSPSHTPGCPGPSSLPQKPVPLALLSLTSHLAFQAASSSG